MKKVACLAVLLAASLQAQVAPEPEKDLRKEVPVDGEAVRKLLESGFLKSQQRCAIPLLQVPPQGKRFILKTVPAVPDIDPKIVVPPPLPACSPVAVTPKTSPTPEPPQDKE